MANGARWIATAVAGLVLLAVGVRLAWLGDDAYITLRAVENLAAGDGLRWNVADRVQVYTHPLWMLVLCGARLLSGEVYFATIGVSLLLSTIAVVWLCARARTLPGVAGVAMLLLAVRAFGDYMTSGLETPLTFVLLVALVGVVRGGDGPGEPARRYTLAVLLSSLLACNRMDLALLCLPPVLSTMPGVPWRGLVWRGACASLPFAAWLAFAWVFYGTPFPVTAHAKAFGVGIPAGELFAQGLRYLLHAGMHDPALLATVVVGAIALLFRRRERWLAVGALCYVAYVAKVGGGFMQGRFLLPPFVVVVACLAPMFGARGWRLVAPVVSVAFVLMWFGGVPNFLLPPSGDKALSLEVIDAQHGIADERRMYYEQLGLLSPTRAIPVFGALEQTVFPEGREQPWILLNGAVGSAGYGAGGDGHILDPLLCDPLIARLPARDPDDWRIGHVLRRIPEGYYESLASGENRMHHGGLRRYYGALRLLTRADVFDGERLAALAAMAVGRYDGDLRAFVDEHYYDPPRIDVATAALPTAIAPGTFWFDDDGMHLVYDGGLALRYDEPQQCKAVRVQVLGMLFYRYRLRFERAGAVVGETVATPLPPPAGLAPLRIGVGLVDHLAQVPAGVGAFDALLVDVELTPEAHKATGPPGIGAVTLQR